MSCSSKNTHELALQRTSIEHRLLILSDKHCSTMFNAFETVVATPVRCTVDGLPRTTGFRLRVLVTSESLGSLMSPSPLPKGPLIGVKLLIKQSIEGRFVPPRFRTENLTTRDPIAMDVRTRTLRDVKITWRRVVALPYA